MDRKGQEQEWPLLHRARSEDGRLWRLCQRSLGPRPHQYPAAPVRWPNQLEGQDSPDSCQQLGGMSNTALPPFSPTA